MASISESRRRVRYEAGGGNKAHPLSPQDEAGRLIDRAPNSPSLIGVRHLDPLGPVRRAPDGTFERLVHDEQNLCVLETDSVIRCVESGWLLAYRVRAGIDGEFGLPLHYVVSEEVSTLIPSESWCFGTYRASAQMWIELSLSLLNDGLWLIDAHPGNIGMQADMQPVWIDHGSIQNVLDSRDGLDEFIAAIYAPMLVLARRPALGSLVRGQMISRPAMSQIRGIRASRLAAIQRTSTALLTGLKALHQFSRRAADAVERREQLHEARSLSVLRRRILRSAERAANFQYRLAYRAFRQLRKTTLHSLLTSIPEAPGRNDFWDAYQDGGVPKIAQNDRDRSIVEHLQNREWRSLLDVGANSGHHIALLTQNIDDGQKRTMHGTDLSDVAISRFVAQMPSLRSRHVLRGSVRGFFANQEPADVVLALALSHHLALQQKYPFSAIARQLGALTKRFCIVEFMPLGLTSSASKAKQVPSWYSLENFILALNAVFVESKVAYSYTSEVGIVRVGVLAEKEGVSATAAVD